MLPSPTDTTTAGRRRRLRVARLSGAVLVGTAVLRPRPSITP
ncbi:hypothetical protein [Kitasatospora sp. NPDC093679]